MPVIAGVTLSKANAEKIAEAALKEARDQGYCGETVTVLENLGFPIPSREVTVLIEARVTLDQGENDDLSNSWNWNLSHDYHEVSSIVSIVEKR